MNALSLFAGIGGFDLGLERAGIRAVAQVEKATSSREVLAVHFPKATRHDDVQTYDAADAVGCELVCGGFPCQDLSVAGKRAGLAGERSGLFFDAMRIVERVAPRWVLLENVPGLLSSRNGADMRAVLGTLAELGYGTAYRVLDAQWFGVAQRRRRVFIVGCADGAWRSAAEVLFESDSLPWNPSPRREAGAGVARCLVAGAGSGGHRFDAESETLVVAFSSKDCGGDAGTLSPTLRSMGFHKSHANGGGQVAIAHSACVRRLTPTECERLMGFPDGWTEGHSDSARYRMLGNAVVPAVAEWIGQRIGSER